MGLLKSMIFARAGRSIFRRFTGSSGAGGRRGGKSGMIRKLMRSVSGGGRRV